MTKPRVALDYQPVYWRSVVLVFVLRVLALIRRHPVVLRRRWAFLKLLGALPKALIFALIVAGAVTLAAALVVRLIIRPLVAYWHSPPVDEASGVFHLAANEWVVESSPARRSTGWRWEPGTLIRTNLRLWFFPRAHDAEVWSCPHAGVAAVRPEPAPHTLWGTTKDWPDRVVVHLADGDPARFAVPEPADVLSWFEPAVLLKKPDPVETGPDWL